jgi:hypothetical protein
VNVKTKEKTRGAEELAHQLNSLRIDYQTICGKPFDHFFCPILFKDEPTELCLGHIVNEKMPASSGIRVVQRKDVDGFYGHAFESHFTPLVQAQAKNFKGVLFDEELSKKMRPRIQADGEDVKHHLYRGHMSDDQTGISLEVDGKSLRLVLHKRPEEMAAETGRKWQIVVERDCRLSAVVSLIKSGYLTLFKLLGYRYVDSPAGLGVGYDILGRFYRDFHDRTADEIHRGAFEFFRPYIHMIRPIVGATGTMPVGTINDHTAMVCFGSSGPPFAMIVSVKTGTQVHGVLMPAYNNAESAATYMDFLANDSETLYACSCKFDPAKSQWEGSDTRTEIHWSKKDANFDQISPI